MSQCSTTPGPIACALPESGGPRFSSNAPSGPRRAFSCPGMASLVQLGAVERSGDRAKDLEGP